MTDWKTIRIPEDDFERHNENRQAQGLTWAEYIAGEAPEPIEWVHGGKIEVEPIADIPDYDRIREIVREETRKAIKELLDNELVGHW